MKHTDVWRAALVRVGGDATTAQQMMAVISAASPEFQAWNLSLAHASGRALLERIGGPDGIAFSQEVIAQFNNRVMEHFNISEADIKLILSGRGRN